MKNKPLISIIIPTFNRADLIGETLDSILAQTYQNWECIVVDDGSSDRTADVLKNYLDKDSRIQFHQRTEQHKPGGNGARNYGFELSNGDYIKWLDSDDLITPYLLEKEINAINENKIDICLSSWKYFDQQNSTYKERNQLVKMHPKNGIDLLYNMGIKGDFSYPSCYLVKKEIINISGPWNEFLRINQDGEFFTRVLINCSNLISLDYLGTLHRKDGDNKVSQDKTKLGMINRINSWILIESYINITQNEKLIQYLENTKIILYNELKRNKNYPLIFKYKNFFKNCIRNEKSRKLKLKFIPYHLKNIFE